MSKVTRYDLNEDVATGTPEISPVPDSFEGPFVSYEDYAALEARVKELKDKQETMVEKDFVEGIIAYGKAISDEFKKRAEAAESELARRKAQDTVDIANALLAGKAALEARVKELEKNKDRNVRKIGETSHALAHAEIYLKEAEEELARLKALGCQPQRFVVKLPEEHGTVFIGGVGVRVFSEPSIIEALKAAGGEIAE